MSSEPKKKTTVAEHGSGKAKAVLDELVRGFDDVEQCELGDTAIEALDRILDLGGDDLFFCEVTCLEYAAHVLELESCPKELWIIPAEDGAYAFPSGEKKRYVEEMGEKAEAIARVIGKGHPCFKGFTNEPPDGPYKLLITTTQEHACEGIPGALAWPEVGSYFNHQLDTTKGSVEAVIYPPVGEQPETQSLREGNGKCSWSVELPNRKIIIGFGGRTETCCMVDLSEPENPWETEASSLAVAAYGGCLVPSLCRQYAGHIEETTLEDLAFRISRGTSLSRKTLNPRPAHEAHKGKALLAVGEDGSMQVPDFWIRDSRYGFQVCEGDYLFLDSSCINADRFEPLFIDEIPKGQERYTITPGDGEVLLISRNEKSFVFYEALRPTLIANSVFIVWLNGRVDNRYLECWLESSYAERWFKFAGLTVSYEEIIKSGEPILSKGTLATLPVPILGKEAAARTVARKYGILRRIQELYSEIRTLEEKEAFAPISAMMKPIEEDDTHRIERALRSDAHVAGIGQAAQ